MDYLRRANGVVRGGVADGRPSLARDVHLAEAILALSGTTNGAGRAAGLAGTGKADRGAPGRPGRRARRGADHVRRHPGAAARGDHLAGVVRQRDRRAPLLSVHGQRGAEETVAHADRADALLPRPRLDRTSTARRCPSTGRRWTTAGTSASRACPQDGRPEITVRYLTPHSKWSIHSEYQDNLHMLRLFRGGPVIWMSPGRGRRSAWPTTTGSRRTTATAWSPAGPWSPTGCRRARCSCTTPRTGT